MPPTIRIRKSDDFSLQYQITDFDETTSTLVEHDLENATIEATLLTSSGVPVITNIACDVLNSSSGWVEFKLGEFPTPGMFKLHFVVEQNDSARKYPSYDYQWVHVLDD